MTKYKTVTDILQYMTSVTGQLDLDSLTLYMADTIRYLYPTNDFRIYSIEQLQGDFELVHFFRYKKVQSARQIENKDRHLLQFLIADESDEDVELAQVDDNTYVYPVMAMDTLFSAIIIEDLEDDDRLEVFMHVLAIYANQMKLLLNTISDHLTGLYNRQMLNNTLNKVLSCNSMHRRNDLDNHSHFLALFDIDHFKRVNDNFGHIIGDEVLVSLSQKAQFNFRDGDMVFRYGGEEFAVILKFIEPDHAYSALERFRHQIETFQFPQVGQVTISMGMTELGNKLQPETALKRADKALYFAKEHGRNKLSSYESLVNDNLIDEIENTTASDIELF